MKRIMQKLNYKVMKRISFKLTVMMILAMVVSCDEPETIVTNYVHPDGSVTRKIEMKSTKNNFSVKSLKVPFDNTWTIKDSLEISKNGDTTWVKRAEKLFKNTDEINLAYKTDTGANKKFLRHTSFEKKFRWFNTEYRFSEIIDKLYAEGYPIKDFLNSEELLFFYSPESVTDAAKNGPDSVRYKILKDSVDFKSGKWMAINIVSAWIGEFSKLTEQKEGSRPVVNSLKSHEKELANLIVKYEDKFDSLWENGIILKQYLGEENYNKFKTETDSASGNAAELLLVDFKNYSVQIAMPGNLTGTNGFIDSSKVLLWPVKSDYFLTENYEMWAESKTRNTWAWIVSGLFLVFVISGVIIRRIKKAE
jgi:hypothetical protein